MKVIKAIPDKNSITGRYKLIFLFTIKALTAKDDKTKNRDEMPPSQNRMAIVTI